MSGLFRCWRHAYLVLASLVWAHGTLDLSANPNAAIALVIMPVYALVPIAVGGIFGYIVDRMLRRKKIA